MCPRGANRAQCQMGVAQNSGRINNPPSRYSMPMITLAIHPQEELMRARYVEGKK